jgi:hypothetical protein
MSTEDKIRECLTIRAKYYYPFVNIKNYILFKLFPKMNKIRLTNFDLDSCYIPKRKNLYDLFYPYFLDYDYDIHGLDTHFNKNNQHQLNKSSVVILTKKGYLDKSSFWIRPYKWKERNINVRRDEFQIIHQWINILYGKKINLEWEYGCFCWENSLKSNLIINPSITRDEFIVSNISNGGYVNNFLVNSIAFFTGKKESEFRGHLSDEIFCFVAYLSNKLGDYE